MGIHPRQISMELLREELGVPDKDSCREVFADIADAPEPLTLVDFQKAFSLPEPSKFGGFLYCGTYTSFIGTIVSILFGLFASVVVGIYGLQWTSLSASTIFLTLVLHVFGDYITQSDWMAAKKNEHLHIAYLHASVYTVPFLLVTQSATALFFIFLTHGIIDHLSLGKYICYFKNFLAPKDQWPDASKANGTGSNNEKPLFISFWLYVIADNFLHIVINYVAVSIGQ